MDPRQQEPPVNLQPQVFPPQPPPHHKKTWLVLVMVVAVLLLVGGVWWWMARSQEKSEGAKQGKITKTAKAERSTEMPNLKTEVVLAGREHIWDIAFLPTKEMLFTERKGTVSLLEGSEVRTLAKVSDVYVVGEGGLLGLSVDPQFTTNRYIYTCLDSTQGDIRVARWTVNEALTGLSDRQDIITGMPRNETGRHSGCRVVFGTDGYLWVGTGDTAQNVTPQIAQNPQSLGGKILRVDRNGKAAPGNLGGSFDPRIYSYGHRNIQGLAFFAKEVKGIAGVSVEHGTDVDDELNLLKPGNFGWAPPDGPYDESKPMTDKTRFPNAIEAIWSSGRPTLAPSGATILKGTQWKAWNGAVAVAMLKSKHLRIFVLDDGLTVAKQEVRLAEEYGRLRAVTLGPSGSLYVSSSNGTDDKIIRLTPQ